MDASTNPATAVRVSPSKKILQSAWLFAGSELAGQRTAMGMSLVQSARLNDHNPCAYLRDVLARLPKELNSQIEELLPHRWQPSAAC